MDMAKLLSLFKDEDDAPKASGCSMCGGNHGLDEDCNMEEASTQSWAYHKDKAAQDNADKQERIARLRRALEKAKLQRDAGNEYAAKRVEEIRAELHELLRTTGEEVEEGWDNEPEEEIKAYDPNEYAGGINRPKKAHKVMNPGGPIREQEELESKIKAELTALYKL